MNPVETLVTALREQGHNPKPVGDHWQSHCPAHNDTNPSLSVKAGDKGGVVWHCLAGCEPAAVIRALGLEYRDLMPERANGAPKTKARARATKPDAQGNSLGALTPPNGVSPQAWQAIGAVPEGDQWAIPERNAEGETIGTAYRKADGAKTFKTGGKRGLIYPHPLTDDAGASWDAPLFVCEGASDTAALLTIGLDAVGVPMAGHCGPMLAALVAGRFVCIVADADKSGRSGAEKVAKALAPKCEGLKIIEPPNGAKDARDAVVAGATRAAFLQALASAALCSESNQSDRAKAPAEKAASDPPQAEQLVQLGQDLFRLGQCPKRQPFAVMNGGANVAIWLGGTGGPMRDTLAMAYRQRFGRVMNGSAYADALATLRGEAMNAPTEAAFIRIGPHGGGVVLDLGTVNGAAVVVDASGWRIVDRSPILFQRTALTGELPAPSRGGRLESLRKLLNVSEETWPILLGWIIAAMIPEIPHPILMLGGSQGTGKTTAARFIFGLFDPSDAPTRSQPRDPEAWAISVANCWGAVIDNVSSIPDWWSDALCKAVTGDGWIRRTLHTDGAVSVLSFRRVIALTSIDAGALRGDLGERLVLVDLEPIAPESRRAERELDAAYKAARPAILGAMLDLLAGVLARLDTVQLPTLPRMADFAKVLAAVDATLGTQSLTIYANQEKRIAAEVLDADPVGESLVVFMAGHREWRGTAGELSEAIKPKDAGREWPKTAKGLGSRVRRLTPALAASGIRVIPPPPNDRRRVFRLQSTAQTAQPPKMGHGDSVTAGNAGAIAPTATPNGPSNRPPDATASEANTGDSGPSGDSGDWSRPSTDTGDNWGES